MKRAWIDPNDSEIPITAQCAAAGLNRSTYYCWNQGHESPMNLRLMHEIDRIYIRYPFYGVVRVTWQLRRKGHTVNHKRIARLMRKMGIQAVLPGPHTSRKHPEHRIYPYLVKELEVVRPEQVWCSDITYIPLRNGWMYLIAVMDWYSRYVLSWELSNTLDTGFCMDALAQALSHGQPEIFNTDQGSQFTSEEFTGRLEKEKIRISMDGRGRAFDNIMIERLWRNVKYENVYIRDYADGNEARRSLREYFRFYNRQRPHQGLPMHTPEEVHTCRT